MDFVFEKRLNNFQTLFLELLTALDKNVDQYEISFDDDLLWVSKHHPTDSSFNLSLSVRDNEIILFFNEFHEHYENYSEPEKLLKDVAIEAINTLKMLINSPKIEIIKMFKGRRPYRYILKATDKQGNVHELQDYYVGWWGFAFFVKTKEEKLFASFL